MCGCPLLMRMGAERKCYVIAVCFGKFGKREVCFSL